MKDEMDELLKNLNATFKAFVRLSDKVIQKLDGIIEKVEKSAPPKKEQPEPEIKGTAESRKSAPKTPAASAEESASAERNLSILDAVQNAIENHPGIDTQSLREKTGFETSQIRNVVPVLKKRRKIKAEKGKYFPIR